MPMHMVHFTNWFISKQNFSHLFLFFFFFFETLPERWDSETHRKIRIHHWDVEVLTATEVRAAPSTLTSPPVSVFRALSYRACTAVLHCRVRQESTPACLNHHETLLLLLHWYSVWYPLKQYCKITLCCKTRLNIPKRNAAKGHMKNRIKVTF